MILGWFLSLSTILVPLSTMLWSHKGLEAGTIELLWRPGSNPCVSKLASSIKYIPYSLHNSYLQLHMPESSWEIWSYFSLQRNTQFSWFKFVRCSKDVKFPPQLMQRPWLNICCDFGQGSTKFEGFYFWSQAHLPLSKIWYLCFWNFPNSQFSESACREPFATSCSLILHN